MLRTVGRDVEEVALGGVARHVLDLPSAIFEKIGATQAVQKINERMARSVPYLVQQR